MKHLFLICLFVISSQAATLETSNLSTFLQSAQFKPGDIVDVTGIQYGPIQIDLQGTPEAPIILRGGIYEGGEAGKGYVVYFSPQSRYVVFENAEVRNSSERGVYVRGEFVTVRNCYLHHNNIGFFSHEPAKEVVLEKSEVAFNAYHNVSTSSAHTVIRHNYIHDSLGGINVKDRSVVNDGYWSLELLYNQIHYAHNGGYEIDLSKGDGIQNSRIVGNHVVASASGNPHMVMAAGVDGKVGDVFLAYNTIAGNTESMIWLFGGQECYLFRIEWQGGLNMLKGEGYIHGDGNLLGRGSNTYSLSNTFYHDSIIEAPPWVPAIAWPEYNPGREMDGRYNTVRPGAW